jgi:hypothetical protein
MVEAKDSGTDARHQLPRIALQGFKKFLHFCTRRQPCCASKRNLCRSRQHILQNSSFPSPNIPRGSGGVKPPVPGRPNPRQTRPPDLARDRTGRACLPPAGAFPRPPRQPRPDFRPDAPNATPLALGLASPGKRPGDCPLDSPRIGRGPLPHQPPHTTPGTRRLPPPSVGEGWGGGHTFGQTLTPP